MWRLLWLGATIGGVAYMVSACRTSRSLETVQEVDLARYLGKWYEVASFPARFQKNCTCTSAEYKLNEDGTISVLNQCFDTKKGKWQKSTARAFVQNEQTKAELAVQFLWPFKGDYYIIALADDYSHALVGTPDRKYLWLLSRVPEMSEKTFAELTQIATAKGFDVSRLQRTKQKDCAPAQ
ncbi:hypothetical protein EZE20_19770 [Arundinibacter roseus]|uniref:Lipocalin/cytosolic fatty-acid binding domain-containing protein n=2 Tax=Arundinibacter roseus TaxID=2070510 RepID=A0A4R4K3W9_9BACT|nr:hypothetical protein EZE20_19770 [Arundinibacter roseus]